MKKFTIKFSTFDEVKRFVDAMSRIPEDADIASGRYIIDAKSIMGLYSLNLSKELELIVHSDDNNRIEEIKKAVSEFIVG